MTNPQPIPPNSGTKLLAQVGKPRKPISEMDALSSSNQTPSVPVPRPADDVTREKQIPFRHPRPPFQGIFWQRVLGFFLNCSCFLNFLFFALSSSETPPAPTTSANFPSEPAIPPGSSSVPPLPPPTRSPQPTSICETGGLHPVVPFTGPGPPRQHRGVKLARPKEV
jgi:hypothetical protein